MTSKNIVVLAGAAAVLGVAAYMTSSGRKFKTPALNGKAVVAQFAAADVAAINVGDKLALAAGEKGWVVKSLHDYPADVAKIRENILKLQDLKVGQVARGRKIDKPVKVTLKGSGGKELASLEMGGQHIGKPRGQMAQFGGGGYPDGRYVKFRDEVVLVKDALDAFDGDFKKWVDTRICAVPSSDVTDVVYASGGEKVELKRKDSSWELKGLGAKEELDTSKTYSLDSALSSLDMSGVADPKLSEAELGFATGAVYTVKLKDGKSYTAKVGNAVNGDRYFKVSAAFAPVGTNATENAALEKAVKEFNDRTAKWTYTIASYSADSMSKKRKDLVKAKEEPKKDDKADKKADEKK